MMMFFSLLLVRQRVPVPVDSTGSRRLAQHLYSTTDHLPLVLTLPLPLSLTHPISLPSSLSMPQWVHSLFEITFLHWKLPH